MAFAGPLIDRVSDGYVGLIPRTHQLRACAGTWALFLRRSLDESDVLCQTVQG